jgi:spermidine/putrescine transport system permease protein
VSVAEGPGAQFALRDDAIRGRREVARLERRRLIAFLTKLAPLLVFTTLFFLIPLGFLFAYSLGSSDSFSVSFGHSFANYSAALHSGIYTQLLLRTLGIGLVTAFACVVLAYAFSYAITLGYLRRHGEIYLLAVLISLFSAYIVRVYAWRTLLGDTGVINETLHAVGIHRTLSFLLYSRFAVLLTLANIYLPLAVLPIYSALAQVNPALIEAARDQGANPLQTVWKIVLPVSMRGVNASFALCFILAAGDYVTPQFVGGSNGQMLGNAIADQFGAAYDWPAGAALAFLLILSMGLVIGLWLLAMRVLGLRNPYGR